MVIRNLFRPGLIIGSILLLLSSCGSKSSENQSAVPQKVESVKVVVLTKKQIDREVEYASSLTAFEEVHLAPSTPGRIERIEVEVGDRVRKGDVVAIMDQTSLHQAMVQLRNAEADFKRFDTLQKVGGVALQQYEQVKAGYDIAKSNADFLAENTRLRAPFSGIVSGKYYEDGEMYSGSPTANGKSAIVSLVQINPLKILVNVSEQFFPMVKRGMEVELVCDIYPGRTFVGRVFRIHPTIDASSRTFVVEVETANGDELLRPGMFARVTFPMEQQEALLVPAIAIMKLQGSDERFLFVVKDGKAHRIGVKLGQRIDDEVEVISSELREGDQLVVFGQARLLDGVPVSIVEE